MGAAGRDVAEALDNALTLLARPFAPGEAIIIKPSNVVNGFAPAMMSLRPQSKALLLRAPLPVFLKSVAKKGMWGPLFGRMIDQFGCERVRILDSETLLGNADACIEQLALLFGLSIDAERRKAILRGPAFATDSKTGAAFSRDERDAAYDEAARLHADEIDKVLIWAAAVERNAKIPTEPGADLLQG
jgi:hypothetical protein